MKKKNTVTLNELVTEKMVIMENDGKMNSAHNYRTLLHFIQKHFGIVLMSECGPEFIKQMDKCLADYSPSTKSTYYSLLKSIWHYAEYKGYTGKCEYPFRRKQYEMDKIAIPKILRRSDWWVDIKGMSEIYHNWENMKDSNIKRYIGLFLTSYLFNGANINDIVRIRFTRDWFQSNGTILSFIRKKTAEKSPTKVRVPITKWVKPILEYMGEKPELNGIVFKSFIDGYDMTENSLFKRIMTLNSVISKQIKIVTGRPDISTTTARHSYSTNLHHLGAPYALTEKNLGHCGTDVAFNYIGEFPDSDLFKWNEKLII